MGSRTGSVGSHSKEEPVVLNKKEPPNEFAYQRYVCKLRLLALSARAAGFQSVRSLSENRKTQDSRGKAQLRNLTEHHCLASRCSSMRKLRLMAAHLLY